MSRTPVKKDGPEEPAQPCPKRVFEKTPMFTAIHAKRYLRQDLIRKIQEDTKRTLFCYVAGEGAFLDKSDAVGFIDMLHNVEPGVPIDLLLHTSGGDVDAVGKLIKLLRNHVGGDKGELRVIVPDFAKSAGTLMALGANTILMSEASELGPIDPQIWTRDRNGGEVCHSVLHYLKAYKDAQEALRANPNDPAARMTFEKFDPTIYQKYSAVHRRAEKCAEDLLLPLGVNFSQIARDLMDIDKYPSHGQMIGWDDARDMGLLITYLPLTDPLWRRYWEIYCHLRLEVDADQRIFESYYVSLTM